MNIEWKTGRPKEDGDYIVVFRPYGYVMQIPFTVEYGWNTTSENNKEHVFPDEDIVAWAELFGEAVLDLFGGGR